MALRTVGVRLTAEISEYQAKLKAAGASTQALVGELDKASKGGHLEKVANAAGIAGLGLAGMAAYAIKAAADFDKSMSAVSAATHASTSDMGLLRAAALQAGKDTQYSATQAADGITELSKAGISTADVLGGGLKGALALAAAGQISVADAASVAASAMTQFKLKGDQIPHLADLLAAGAGKAQGGVGDLSNALNQSGLVAAQFGLSVEDTVGALSEFANAGLLGADAGISLKTMLLQLAQPSSKTKDLMNQLGISFYDAQGKFVGLSGVAEVLQSRLKGLSQEQRNAALAQIFGTDAIRSASILYTDGVAGVEKWKNAVNDSGYASSTAAKLTDNLAGDLERLRGSLETVAIQSGGGATQGLRSLTQGANAAVNAFADLPGWVQQSVTVVSGLGGAGLLAGAGFIKARSTAKDFLGELRDMGPMGTRAAEGLGKIGSIAGKLGVAGIAAVGLYEGFKLFGDWVDHFSAPVARDVDKMSTALQEFASSGKVTGELAKTFGANLQGLDRDLAAVAKSQADFSRLQGIASGPAGQQGADRAMAALAGRIKDQSAQARVNIAALDATLTQMATSGGANQAKIAFQQLAAASGVNLAQLPQYQKAAEGAALANTGLAKGFGSATSNAKTMTDTLESAIKAGQSLTDVWTQLNGATLGTDKGMLAASQAIDAVKAAFKANKDAVDGNSEAALKNRIAVGDAAEAAVKAAQAKYDETGSVMDATRTYGDYIGQLRRTLLQSGLNKQQVDRLLAAYAQMPASVATHVSAPGASTAINQVRTLKAELASMKTNWNVTVRQNFLTFGKPYSAAGVASGNIGGLAEGGAVRGPGTGTSDSIVARLSSGEHVWTAAEVAAAGGHGAVAALRSSAVGHPVRMAAGGYTQMTPAPAVQRVIVETRNVVEFAGGPDAFGQLMLNTLRIRPGVRKTMAKQLAS
jgi:TP901 family phage tail tape measure protein